LEPEVIRRDLQQQEEALRLELVKSSNAIEVAQSQLAYHQQQFKKTANELAWVVVLRSVHAPRKPVSPHPPAQE
jgi:hypothetical protein